MLAINGIFAPPQPLNPSDATDYYHTLIKNHMVCVHFHMLHLISGITLPNNIRTAPSYMSLEKIEKLLSF